MPHQDEDLHAAIMNAFREYFIANQKWAITGTAKDGVRVRHCLRIIRQLCEVRRDAIMAWRYELNALKAERREKRNVVLGPEVVARRRANLKKASDIATARRLAKKNQNPAEGSASNDIDAIGVAIKAENRAKRRGNAKTLPDLKEHRKAHAQKAAEASVAKKQAMKLAIKHQNRSRGSATDDI